MPYIVTTSIYPTEKASQVAEKFFEVLQKYPPDENLAVHVVPAAVKSTHEGIEVIHIEDVKEGKLEDALKQNINAQVILRSVGGYRYLIEIYLKAEEALASIGMSMPE